MQLIKKNQNCKLLLIIFYFIISSNILSAQSFHSFLIPKTVSVSFFKHFPGIIPFWKKVDTHYEAGFHQNGKEMSALFDANGTLTETEVAIKIAELPAAIHQYIQQKYPGATIKEASIITLANGTKHYEAEVNGQDLIFDSAGNFI
ncbi:MAG: PepSY-like domain-containing protein, partial [Bacteroidota bacterium]|nr:PepSY-like domain-containing protein [Bacteroidota bacterium]